MKRFLPTVPILIAAATAVATPANAEPPEDSMKLSQIAVALEALPGYLYLQEMSWDDEAEGWTAIYRVSNGMDKRVRVDARTGAISEDGGEYNADVPSVTKDDVPSPAGVDGSPATTPGAAEGDDTLIPTPNGMK